MFTGVRAVDFSKRGEKMTIKGGKTASEICRMAFLLALAWLLHWIKDSASSRVKSASVARQVQET